MDNDTPGVDAESHDPLIPERNGDDAPSVQQGMDDTDTFARPAEPATTETLGGPLPPPPPPAPPTVPITPVSARIQPAPPRRSSVPLILGAFAAAILGSVLTVGVFATTGMFDNEPAAPAATTTPTSVVNRPITEITNEIGSAVNPTAVAQKVLPSVVTVNVFSEAGSDLAPDERIPTGSGSGVVRSSDGYLITNHHVISGGDSYTVTFEDGRTYDATLVGSDELTDLAVLKIDATGLEPIEYGTLDGLAIGDPAVAVGNPLGQQGGSSITVGIISAFDRRVDFADETTLFGMIQTDAAINSGSSGGALVDAEGKLIGITSAIGVSTAGPEGIGYAIPVDIVDRITSEIIETGDVVHPFIGVQIQTYFDIADDGAVIPDGAIIESIEGEDSAAGDAGMMVGDIIIQIDDETINSQPQLISAVRLYRVGETAAFTVKRGDDTLTFDVVMGTRPPEFRG
ncbi:MAG: trypsin-like peptidase domain-containing protein [Acidimicrobiia bacterium]